MIPVIVREAGATDIPAVPIYTPKHFHDETRSHFHVRARENENLISETRKPDAWSLPEQALERSSELSRKTRSFSETSESSDSLRCKKARSFTVNKASGFKGVNEASLPIRHSIISTAFR